MNEIIIREYRPDDVSAIITCLEKLQDHVTEVDNEHLLYQHPAGFGPKYTEYVMEKVKKYNGTIMVAEKESQIVGFAAGIIEEFPPDIILMHKPHISGRIIEIFVDSHFRGAKIGSRLVEKMEEYFREKGCEYARIEVLKHNTGSHRFYNRHGYEDRMIDTIKKL